MELSRYAQGLLRSHSCHCVKLIDPMGDTCYGIYSTLSYWGRVEKDGEEIETLYADGEHFSIRDFRDYLYKVVAE